MSLLIEIMLRLLKAIHTRILSLFIFAGSQCSNSRATDCYFFFRLVVIVFLNYFISVIQFYDDISQSNAKGL